MNSDTIISVSNVSKCYRVFDSPWARLCGAFAPNKTRAAKEVWALRDVSFEVQRGEAVGIIGRNGSGKSTLLELITGTLMPTAGEIHVQGRVAALLELGSGFNPEFTGRENVYLGGLLLGLSRHEIETRFDDIAGFADIGDVLDQPVKTYSSGMLVRLAFSVQVAIEPEILIVDEALSVGDFFFQQKCFGRLRKMRERGMTLLFVSHDMGTVRNLCQKAIYLKRGCVIFGGDSSMAIHHYLNEFVLPQASSKEAFRMNLSHELVNDDYAYALWENPSGIVPEPGHLQYVLVMDESGKPVTSISIGEVLVVRIYFSPVPGQEVHISLNLKNRFDQLIISTGSYLLGLSGCESDGRVSCALEIELECNIEAGEYSLSAAVGTEMDVNKGCVLDNSGWFGPVEVRWDYETFRAPFLGMFGVPTKARYIDA